MKKINISIFGWMALFSGLLMTSCQKTIDVGATSAVKVANHWWCRLLDSQGNELVSYSAFDTYNTSDNKDSMWVDDDQDLYGFKVKAKFNTDGTFETAQSFNDYFDPQGPFAEYAVITDGKVMSKAAKSKTGVTVDSIYMKINFSDDPNTTYVIQGIGYTGWDDDSY